MGHLDISKLLKNLLGELELSKADEDHLVVCPVCQGKYRLIQQIQMLLLHSAEKRAGRTDPRRDNCPDDQQIVNYVEGTLLKRGNFRLSEEEQNMIVEHIGKCISCLQEVISTYHLLSEVNLDEPLPLDDDSEVPVQEEPDRIPIAAADESELDMIRSRIGSEFIERGSIVFGEYSADIYFQDLHSANLVFKKNDKRTSELSGMVIEFFLMDKPMAKYSDEIGNDRVTIDFSQLGLSIQDYEKVVIRIPREKSRVIIFLNNFRAIEE